MLEITSSHRKLTEEGAYRWYASRVHASTQRHKLSRHGIYRLSGYRLSLDLNIQTTFTPPSVLPRWTNHDHSHRHNHTHIHKPKRLNTSHHRNTPHRVIGPTALRPLQQSTTPPIGPKPLLPSQPSTRTDDSHPASTEWHSYYARGG